MHSYYIIVSFFLQSVSKVHAWGAVGHTTVAAIAQNYLTPQAQVWVSKVLGSGVTMGSQATWADDFRRTVAGRFSGPLHYIDVEDNPPSNCTVAVSRDCGSKGCIVSAIANYTSRVKDDSLSPEQQKQALEFLIHFLGDITQPLHAEAKAEGGNKINVTFEGRKTNLHAAWDHDMVEKIAGGQNSTAIITSFSSSLITEIDNGKYQSKKREWISCVDPSKANQCALTWAQDSNALNCEYALKVDEQGKELDPEYYLGAKPIIMEQIAKGGYRLAKYLNNLAVESTETALTS